ncbi:unnamed protein product, partial [Rotaria sordida]
PLINSDVHFLIDQPHVAYVHITINGIQIPLVAVRRHDDTFLLKFRPILAGDYLIILKDYIGQLIPEHHIYWRDGFRLYANLQIENRKINFYG